MPDTSVILIVRKHAAMTHDEVLESVREAVRYCVAAGHYPGRDRLMEYGAKGRNSRIRWAISILRANGEMPPRPAKKPMACHINTIKPAMLKCIADGEYPSVRRLRRYGAVGDSTPVQEEATRLIDSGEVVLPPTVKAVRGKHKLDGTLATRRRDNIAVAPPRIRVKREPRAGMFGESVREVLKAERGLRRWRDKWVAGRDERANQEVMAQ